MALQILVVLYVAVAAAIGVYLFRRFRQSGNRGFLVLIVGLSVWPFISALLNAVIRSGADRAIGGQGVQFPFTSVTNGEVTLGTFVAMVSTALDLVQLVIVLLGLGLVFRGIGGQRPAAQLRSTPDPVGSPERS